MKQKVSSVKSISFNISSLLSTFQYVVDVDKWKDPGALSYILMVMTDPLYTNTSPPTYDYILSSKLHLLIVFFLRSPIVLNKLEAQTTDRLLFLHEHFCHICNLFFVLDEEFQAHMKRVHGLPIIHEFTPFSSQFLVLLTKQIIAEYRTLCPKEEFYRTRCCFCW